MIEPSRRRDVAEPSRHRRMVRLVRLVRLEIRAVSMVRLEPPIIVMEPSRRHRMVRLEPKMAIDAIGGAVVGRTVGGQHFIGAH